MFPCRSIHWSYHPMNWYIFSKDADSGCSWWAVSGRHSPVLRIVYVLYLHELLDIKQYLDGMEIRLNRVKEWFLSPLTGRQPVHNAESRDKLGASTVRKKVQTPCSAVIQYDLHSFYTQRSLPSKAAGRISRYCRFGQRCLPFEPRRILDERNASVSSALKGPAGSSCSTGRGRIYVVDRTTHESRASVNLCSK